MNTQLKEFTKVKTDDYVVEIKDACEKNGKYSSAIPIGYYLLDNAMKVKSEKQGGVRAGDLVVITGLSGSGKTMFAQNITMNLNKIGVSSLWFSYEVIVDNLYAKFVEMKMKDENNIHAPKKIISGNLKWIKEKIIEGQKEHETDFIFIDHIDFLSPSKLSSDQRRITIRDICQELKYLAVELKITIFLMAHIKKVQGREVEMQDLAESGALYQIPDYVFSIGRNYRVDNENGREIKTPLSEGIVKFLKNRLTGEMPYLKFKVENNIITPTV